MTRPLSLVAVATALLCPSAHATETCDVLEARDDASVRVIDVSASSGECSVTFGTQTITSTVDPDLDDCSVSKVGGNIIIIWPNSPEGGFCTATDGGVLDVLVWPT